MSSSRSHLDPYLHLHPPLPSLHLSSIFVISFSTPTPLPLFLFTPSVLSVCPSISVSTFVLIFSLSPSVLSSLPLWCFSRYLLRLSSSLSVYHDLRVFIEYMSSSCVDIHLLSTSAVSFSASLLFLWISLSDISISASNLYHRLLTSGNSILTSASTDLSPSISS